MNCLQNYFQKLLYACSTDLLLVLDAQELAKDFMIIQTAETTS